MTLRALAEASAYCSLMTLTAVDDGDPDEVPVLHRTAYVADSEPGESTVTMTNVVFASNSPEELFWNVPPVTETV